MNTFIKITIAGAVGYLIGFYEMKHKAQQKLLEVLIDSCKEEA